MGAKRKIRRPLDSPLDTYQANYRNGPGCDHGLEPVFRKVKDEFHVQRVLYPGSYLHITPSLFFPRVCYVDSLAGIADALADPDLRRYIADHRDYPQAPEILCYQQDYRAFTSGPEASFDLLISLNAGLVSQAGKRFLAPGGLLLVNDEHYDARRAFVDPDYRLSAVCGGEDLRMETSESELAAYFKTSQGIPLTLEMVESDIHRPPSRARFKPSKSAVIYLFTKQ